MNSPQQRCQVSIVTVGMNHLKYLKPYLNSLFNQNTPQCIFELIYVDNCSTDGSVEFVKSNYPSVKVVANSKPLGFGENNNIGVSFATGKYVAIINPDIEILPNSVDNLYKYAESIDFSAIIAPKLLNKDGSFQQSVRRYMTLKVFIMRAITRGNDGSHYKSIQSYLFNDIDKEKTQYIDWAIGASLFMKTDLFKTLGGFDTDYFLYFEDVDLCVRSWNAGSPVIYYPKSEMIHNHLRASAKLSKKTIFHFKSMLTFFAKHGISIKSKYNLAVPGKL
jgi:N-acetylglucosaminyl-diphospho-decaprenol L-rhamnosyltransferase